MGLVPAIQYSSQIIRLDEGNGCGIPSPVPHGEAMGLGLFDLMIAVTATVPGRFQCGPRESMALARSMSLVVTPPAVGVERVMVTWS